MYVFLFFFRIESSLIWPVHWQNASKKKTNLPPDFEVRRCENEWHLWRNCSYVGKN
jgi:hypothetical protein